LDDPVLCLNGGKNGIVNNLAVMSDVAPGYAPDGQALISVTTLGDTDGAGPGDVKKELRNWFGRSTADWTHLKTFEIDKALPVNSQESPDFERGFHQVDGMYVCGDFVTTPSINGALRSGRTCAEAILNEN
jgi:hypothetical protein